MATTRQRVAFATALVGTGIFNLGIIVQFIAARMVGRSHTAVRGMLIAELERRNALDTERAIREELRAIDAAGGQDQAFADAEAIMDRASIENYHSLRIKDLQ